MNMEKNKVHEVYCKPLDGAIGEAHSRYFHHENDAKSLMAEFDGCYWSMTYRGLTEVDPDITVE